MQTGNNMPATPKEYLRTLGILHKALIIGAGLFALIAFITVQANGGGLLGPEEIKKTGIVFLAAAVLLAGFCLFKALTGYNRSIAKIRNEEGSLMKKLNQYHSALILYLALCEGPALFSIIIFFLTGNYMAFIITVIMLAAMMIKAPVQRRVAEELGLNWNEQQKF